MSSAPPTPLAKVPPAAGRFAVYAAASALTGIVPFPVLPRRILQALRGALAFDVCARHGLALTPDARSILSDPRPPTQGRSSTFTREALAWVGRRAVRRVAPLGVVYAPMRDGFDMLAFGHLLDRYLSNHRSAAASRSVRIEAEEAIAIRTLLDRAVMRAVELGLEARAIEDRDAPEDYRGAIQRAVDSLLISASKVPEVIDRRLDAALDDVVGHVHRFEP